MKNIFVIISLIGSFVFAEETTLILEEDSLARLTRSDNIPEEAVMDTSDSYFEGYLQALVNMNFYEYRVVVIVKDHNVWLANLTNNKLIAESIVSFLKDVPTVKEVKVIDGVPPEDIAKREKYVSKPQVSGIWFPQQTELFQPLIASPRQVNYSIGYRFGDHVCGKSAVPISLGDDFPLFRWLDVLWNGDLQIGIEAGIWAVFNMNPEKPNINGGTELVNTDYYVGFPLSYARNKWTFRLRGYHISSHLGDEFMVNHPGFHRLNPSFEAIDLFGSYQVNDGLRLYVGPGVILHSDSSFPMQHAYVEYGGEYRFWGQKIYYHKLYGTFFLGGHWRNWQYHHWQYDGTYVFGYEWSKLQGVGRKVRIMAEAHNGFSLEGQFSRRKTAYGAILVVYGF